MIIGTNHIWTNSFFFVLVFVFWILVSNNNNETLKNEMMESTTKQLGKITKQKTTSGDAKIMSLFIHVRRDDGQGDHPAGGRVPGAVHSRPVRDSALQKEPWAIFVFFSMILFCYFFLFLSLFYFSPFVHFCFAFSPLSFYGVLCWTRRSKFSFQSSVLGL